MKKPALNTSLLRSRLKLKSLQSESVLRAHHPQAIGHLEKKGIRPGGLRIHAAKLLTTGAIAGSMMLNSSFPLPIQAALPAGSTASAQSSPKISHLQIVDFLKTHLPSSYGHLDSDSEAQFSTLLHSLYGIHASAQLEGNRLNHSFGLIGAEQHLPRFPGDTIGQHGAYIRSGITPGRGAWGYFVASKAALSPDILEKEKYYFAVQTLYLSDWSTRLPYLRDWYKFRKMVAVNTQNGKTIVGVVADSGPAAWTGKHFGGSPEIMDYLDLNVGRQKGPVVMFFVDDPDNSIPLGPLEYNLERPPLLVQS